MSIVSKNQAKNKEHYEKLYSKYNVKNILYWINNLESFLESATSTETSWFAIYNGNFRKRIKGKKVLEMGCGDCVNAAIMAALGAEVYANDIADASGEIIKALNKEFSFTYPIKFVSGDFLKNDLPNRSFDFVIGKAFLHHLELDVEKKFLAETNRLLKKEGEARFFEPAINSLLLDKLRWYVPVKGRPSKFKAKEFKAWKQNDPHPDRSFSSIHFKEAGKQYFKDVEILPVGTLERFSRFFSWGEKKNAFKRWALKAELKLPKIVNHTLTRSQLIIYRSPINL